MNKNKKTSLQERGRTLHSYQAYSEDISYPPQEDVSVNRDLSPNSHQDDVLSIGNRKNRTPYSRRDDDLSNKDKDRTPYSRRDGDLSNENRDRTPYSRHDDEVSNRNRDQTPYSHRDDDLSNRIRDGTPYSRHDDEVSNRNRDRTPYSHLDDSDLSNRNRDRTPYSRRDDDMSNRIRDGTPYSCRDNEVSNRNRDRTPYSHRDDEVSNRNRDRTPYSRRDDSDLSNRNRVRTPYSRHDGDLSNKDKNWTPYSHRDDDVSNRNRDGTPYSHQGDASYSEEISFSHNRQDTSSNRNKNRTPYSLRTPYSHRENYARENVRGNERSHGRNESRERSREGDFIRRDGYKNYISTTNNFISEIAELRIAISDLARKVKEIHQEKEENQPRTQHSLPPSPPSTTRYTKFRKVLEPMNHEYKKAFRDEVVQILKGLDDSLTIGHKNRWIDIERHVTQDIIPVIKRVLGDRFQYTDTELKKVLQNLHRHRRDAYNVSKNPLKSKANKQRTGTNTRRKDKKERRQRGFRHMVNIKDQKLIDLQPSIPWDDWIEGFEAIINDSSYHSDEISESDEEKVQEERNRNIRPSRNENSNHVLHVYDKQWRSSRIRNLLRHADLTGESIQNIKVGRKRWYNDQLYIEDNSKPPHNAPAWAISSSYLSE